MRPSIERFIRRPRLGAPGYRAAIPLTVFASLLWLGCRAGDDQSVKRQEAGNAEQGIMVKAPAPPATFGLGREPSGSMLAARDIDANPAGIGLPPGSGSYSEGVRVYAEKCAACHGARGEGVAIYPQLIGAAHADSFPFGNDPKIPKTIGNYWPYATTLYDYIHRAMPYGAPGSLRPGEVYSVVAYLLAENQIIPRSAVIDAKSLPKVKMPAQPRFVPDDRKGGASFR